MYELKMEQMQDSLKTDPELYSLTRKLKVEQIQDGLKTDPILYFTDALTARWSKFRTVET
jgi:hypothetical protein